MYLRASHVCGGPGQKMALEPLEMELQTVLSCHVGDENQIGPLQGQQMFFSFLSFFPFFIESGFYVILELAV